MVSGSDLFIGMFNNLALFIILVAVYGALNAYFGEARSARRQVALGISFGLFAIGCMHVKIPVADGVIVDQRNAVVALCGAFAGPLSALICAAMSGAYRVYLGGAGIYGGVIGVILSAGAGAGVFYIRSWIDTFWKAGLCAACATILILPGFLFFKDLGTGWALLKAMAIPYGSAVFIGMFMVGLLLAHEEIRHRSKLALKRSERRFRNLYENLIDVSYRTDKEGYFVEVSPSAEKIFGYTHDEIIGKRITDAYRNPDRRDELLAQLKRDGKVENFESEVRTKDNTYVWVSTNARMLTDADGAFSGVEGVTRDISRQKKSEREKQQLEESLRQSQKMEALGTLAGGIAHDFNNILGAVIGYTEMAIDDLPAVSESRRYMKNVLTASERAADLTRQILTFSRKSTPVKKPLNVHRTVIEAVKLLRKTLPSTVKIDVDLDPRTGLILADSTQIHQIVLNLCTNAYHALKLENGEIHIQLREEMVDQITAGRYPNLKEGPYARLTVKDNGIGMNPSTIERIFEPFFTSKAPGKGTGMGLSVVHGIVKDHDGSIGVESELGGGSTFHVFLPLTDIDGISEPAPSIAPPQGSEHILLIDDESALAQLGKSTLETFGYQVTAMTSARDAIGRFRDAPDAFDLIVTDQTMPEMTGDFLTKTALQIRPDIPVIICTGHSELLDEKKAKEIGSRAFLMKPLDRNLLAVTVRRVLDESPGKKKGAESPP